MIPTLISESADYAGCSNSLREWQTPNGAKRTFCRRLTMRGKNFSCKITKLLCIFSHRQIFYLPASKASDTSLPAQSLPAIVSRLSINKLREGCESIRNWMEVCYRTKTFMCTSIIDPILWVGEVLDVCLSLKCTTVELAWTSCNIEICVLNCAVFCWYS